MSTLETHGLSKAALKSEARKLLLASNMKSKARKNKFGVRLDPIGKAARTIDGILFDSAKEAQRYAQLKLLERAGHISRLQRQHKLSLKAHSPAGEAVHCGMYVCDFFFFDNRAGKFTYEDCKGARTALYRLKKKIVEACHGVEILET